MICGFLLTVCSIISSIIFGFYFWYSFYVVGAFIFFGALNCKHNAKTVFTLLCEKKIKKFLMIYLGGVLFSFFVDIVYGRNVSSLWHYPHLSGSMSLIIPVFIYYPFGGLQVYEIFYCLKRKLNKKIKNKSLYKIPKAVRSRLSYLFIIFLISGVVIPILNFYLNANESASELIVIFMILTTFSADMIIYRFNKKSILFSLLEGNKLVLATMVLSWTVSMLLTEYPNTFSWEWIYTMPFTNFEVAKMNIVVITFGWFFLVYAPLRSIDLILYLLKEK